MLEEKRENRPYATNLLALWNFPAEIYPYKTSWLPLAYCKCSSSASSRQLPTYDSWPKVLKKVSIGDDWSSDSAAVAKWTTATIPWYDRWHFRYIMRAALQGLEEENCLFFGSNLAPGVRSCEPFYSPRKLGQGIVAALQEGSSSDDHLETFSRIRAIFRNPEPGVTAKKLRLLTDTILRIACDDAQGAEFLAKICGHMWSFFTNEIGDVVQSGHNSDGDAVFKIDEYLHHQCRVIFQGLYAGLNDQESSCDPARLTPDVLGLFSSSVS
ncbi:hypothetical protein K458DRAFT_492134 [Lentithecium fluviatile CBS 122367]|uniref:Uncharacterized protein n=1 Tax=Lentithecium fluviatile CBS 122367 TaxID=1168545 RepID=A0A6G1IG63_9PLEO|nr:hypothetical protein K458DRAFT_492134 [Lentithecium fluviatile CBS 122367]